MIRRTVLVVEDNEINRRLLSAILSGEYDVLSAKNGKEALDIIAQAYDIISAVLLDLIMPEIDGYTVLSRMRGNEATAQIPVIVTTSNLDLTSELRALTLGANDYVTKPYNPDIIRHRLRNTISLRETAAAANAAKWDSLTGLYSRIAFFEEAEDLVASHKPGYYCMSSFDIDGFKVINDQYGTMRGDEVLQFIATTFIGVFDPIGGICCRMAADDFAVLYPSRFMDTPELQSLLEAVSIQDGSMQPIPFSIGRYVIDDTTITVDAMYDRATIAKRMVKGRFDKHIAQYDESMRKQLLQEQTIVNEMKNALATNQFEVWFQPQYDHPAGQVIGAEALVRWRRPEKDDLIFPNEFIPVFERNGFIYELDKFVWRQTCKQIRALLDAGQVPLPISINVSRHDVFCADFIDVITGLIKEYDIPVNLLRVEITETAFAEETNQIISVTENLVKQGFIVEIDDFGNGYSSLNTLKDVPASVLKLDMAFLKGCEASSRGSHILQAIIQMAQRLNIAIIAEGVETLEQADYLASIGCNHVQGYYYCKPLPAHDFAKLTEKNE